MAGRAFEYAVAVVPHLSLGYARHVGRLRVFVVVVVEALLGIVVVDELFAAERQRIQRRGQQHARLEEHTRRGGQHRTLQRHVGHAFAVGKLLGDSHTLVEQRHRLVELVRHISVVHLPVYLVLLFARYAARVQHVLQGHHTELVVRLIVGGHLQRTVEPLYLGIDFGRRNGMRRRERQRGRDEGERKGVLQLS